MKAITFQAIGKVSVDEVDEPKLREPTDALVRVHLAALCGSDLHPYHGRECGLDPGTIMGHEFLGEIVEVGADVGALSVGDQVVSPFTTSCGECFYCQSGLTARCERGQLFGWVEEGRGLHGGQAEWVRVPLADATLMKVPAGTEPEAALLAGDVLSTGFFCAELAAVEPGATVAVIGAGPVGLCGTIAAVERGAARVFVFDAVPERLALAASFGGIPCSIKERDPTQPLFDHTQGRGADCVLECVGSEASTRAAYSVVRIGGTIGAAGVHTEPTFAFSPGEAYDKNLSYRAGRCPARAVMNRTLPLVSEGRLPLSTLFSHRVPLEEGPRAYEIFSAKQQGCTKVLFTF